MPTPLEQADNLILWIGDNQITPDAWRTMILLLLVSDAVDETMSLLQAQQRQEHPSAEGGKFRVMLEMAGWERYEALRRRRIESRTVFMALKFNEPVLDRVVSDCVLPAVEQTGFSLRILTEPQGAGSIDNQLRAALLSARFVISDLTHDSFGSYWEAGFGEARGTSNLHV